MLGMIALLWHYVVCLVLLLLCKYRVTAEKRWVGFLLSGIMLPIGLAGSALAFQTVFVTSGKTLELYVTKYGIYSLTVFLFPIAGLILSALHKKTVTD